MKKLAYSRAMVLYFATLIIISNGCAKEPDVKVAHGEDQNLYLKTDLIGGPYGPTELIGKSSKLALVTQSIDTDKFQFVIEEDNLHVYSIKDGITKPYLVYDILAHVDLVRETDKNGREGRFLSKSTTANLDWRKRAYIEVNPASFKEVKIAFGEDRNLFRKSDFPSGAVNPATLNGSLGRLATVAIKDKVSAISFSVGKGILNVYKVLSGKEVPYVQYKISGHYDLKQPKDENGNTGILLEKDDATESFWKKREYVEIDPYDLKKIDLEKLKAEKDLNLFSVGTLDKGSFSFMEDRIPGIDEKLQLEIAQKYSLNKGTKIFTSLTQGKLYLKIKDSSGSSVIVATAPVIYFDLKQSLNDDDELTSQHVLDQTTAQWEKRKYVLIVPESAAIESNDQKLVDKNLLANCYEYSKIPFPEIRSAIEEKAATDEKICFDVSQSFLSVYIGEKSQENLAVVYNVTGHLDLSQLGESNGSGTNAATWDKRRYMIISANAPQKVKRLVNPNAITKNQFNGEFLYITTIEKSHSEAGGRFIPGMRNVLDGRIRFEFSQDKITAYRTKETLNTNTKTPVLRFSSQHFTVERIKNGVGDETATIAETSERAWDDETHVRVAFDRNEIPGYFNEYFGLEKIYYRRHLLSQSRLQGEVTIAKDGMITFYTEDVLTPDASSGNFGSGETALQPKSVILRHTFMPINNGSYKAKKYSAEDFKKFGFFRTFEYKLDENGRPTDDTLFTYINRFDLSKDKQIFFTVNEEFPEKYWEVAERAIAEWNKAFQKATGREDDVVVLKENSGESYTDPRVNMIAYIPDRIITGILGYGPMINDPETGKIYSSQTYLYDAVFKSVNNHLEEIYDYVVANVPNVKVDEGAKSLGFVESKQQAESVVTAMRNQLMPNVWRNAESNSTLKNELVTQSAKVAAHSTQNAAKSNISRSFERLSDAGIAALTEDLPELLESDIKSDLLNIRKALDQKTQSKINNIPHCFYGSDSQLSSAIKFIRLNKDKSKEEVLEILEKQSVYTTLLHELGHNFGLRHNFHGSFDEGNFDPEYHKLKKEIADAENPADVEKENRFLEMWKSTSVMDYIPSIEEQFSGLGAYDKAAILYGYGEMVEAEKSPLTEKPPVDGKYHSVPLAVIEQLIQTLSEANPNAPLSFIQQYVKNALGIRSYLFCTDDHVDNDPSCNRHDTGVNVEDIVNNWIADYELNYLLYSERNNRRNYTGSSSFVMWRYFLPMRQMLDEFVYKLVTNSFSGPTGPGGQQDYINALITSLNFFTEILETPESGPYHFDEKEKKFVTGASTEEGVKNLVIPEGMGKKLMATFGEINGIDQATKRGHLYDKLIAMLALTLRGYPAEKYERASLRINYYDFEVFRKPLFETFSKMMQGGLTKTTKAVFIESAGAYLAITDEVAQQLPDNMDVIDAALDAASNNIVEDYSMIFAVDDFNNDADQTFADYVDFRIAGVDDASIPEGVETLKFKSASGVKEYVVPQTIDGRSIAYSITKDAPAKAEAYHEAVDFLNDPAQTEALATALETAFPIVLSEFKMTWEKVEGTAMPEEIENMLNSDKESGLERMTSLSQTLLTNFTGALAAAEAAGNEEDIKKFTELVTFMEERIKLSGEATKDYISLKKSFDEKKDKVDELKGELTEIESRLLKIKRYYGILN